MEGHFSVHKSEIPFTVIGFFSWPVAQAKAYEDREGMLKISWISGGAVEGGWDETSDYFCVFIFSV